MNIQENLVQDLSELLNIEAGIRESVVGVTYPQVYAMAGVEDKLRQWLNKVQGIATQYNVAQYTITLALSWPPGIQASFTWSQKKDGAKNYI